MALPFSDRVRDALRPPVIWIAAFAVLLRVAAALYAGNHVAPLPGAFDQIWYDGLAQRVATGHGFAFAHDAWPLAGAGEPTAHWSYLYTTFLAALYALFGHHPLLARLVQAVATGILLPWGTWRLARLSLGERTSPAAALLAAGYAYFVYYGAMLMTEAFTITAVVWLLALAVELADDPRSHRRWIAFGALVGVAGLLRQVVLLPVPAICLWIAWRHRRSDAVRAAVLGVALAAVTALLFIAPATLRNVRAFDRFVLLNTNAGYAFFWANHPVHGSDFKDILGPEDPRYQDLVPPELRHLDEAALDRALMARGLGFVRENPVRYFRLSLSRIDDYFKFWPSAESGALSNLARVLSFGILWPFMAGGLWLGRRDWRRTMPLLLFAGLYAAVHLASWALVRYRLPVDGVLLVFAGLAVQRLVDRVRARARFGQQPSPSAFSGGAADAVPPRPAQTPGRP